jgi:hypothetical protein
MIDEIQIEKTGGGVAELVLNRPTKHNAITPAMSAAIREALKSLNRTVKSAACWCTGRVNGHFAPGPTFIRSTISPMHGLGAIRSTMRSSSTPFVSRLLRR